MQPAVQTSDGDSGELDQRYRPFLQWHNQADDWIASLELDGAKALHDAFSSVPNGRPLRILVLYGSLRSRSFSKLMAYEASRILHRLGPDVRVYDPQGLPVRDDSSAGHAKVLELRALSDWSDAHFWCSPEQHGNLTAVFKNQIDWIPLSSGSVRPTQGRTLALCQVNGGSQSFNTLNSLRILGRWMRMFTIPNQSSLPKGLRNSSNPIRELIQDAAWTQFTDAPHNRLRPSSNRDRLVDVCEELVKTSIILFPHAAILSDRYSERLEQRAHGRLRTQAEVEGSSAKDSLYSNNSK